MNTVKNLLRYIRRYRLMLLLALLCAVISVGFSLYIPVLVGEAIDYMLGKGMVDFGEVGRVVLIMLILITLIAVFRWFMDFLSSVVSARVVRDLRNDLFRKTNTLPLRDIDSRAHGDLISRITNDVEAVGDGMTQVITKLFSGIVTIVGTLIFMLMINVWIALVVVVLTPLSVLVAAVIGKMCAKSFREQQRLQGEISSYVEEIIGNQKVVKSFSYEERSQAEFEKQNKKLFKAGLRAQFAGALANPSTRFVNNMVYAATGIAGALTVVSAFMGTLTIGGLSCFLTYANQYTKPFNEVTGVLTQIQTALAAGERIFNTLSAESEPDESDKMKLDNVRGELEFKNVRFSYSADKELIKNFSLKVKSGQQVAIVGPTGCGKTTLINLIMRFYETLDGEILLDGISTKGINRDNLRQKFGMVLQDSWLFSGTIMDNLRYGNPNASDEEIIAAAKMSYAHSFIRKMPDGYNTKLNENAENLSAGQKQLLCIARAMALDPPVLILDEATSSIDTLTEIRVQKAFKKLMKGRTSFIVAHRLSTIKESDIILVMNDGDIIEQGTHDELLKSKGFYYNLYNSQFIDS
ncbi:MAG: ABC transporter ATP-binding protein/permease [Ruminococcus sp.]|nr:ABC transporter ATP-binding protein/permease [Ruminococcus sp.]